METMNVPTTFARLDGNKSLFNNPRLSDVRFLVDGHTVYGHKQILALGSPVFESMFFGELKEQREVIEIKDLTLIGFKNALRYIYGFEIDFELSELCESYLAADKYLAHEFSKEFLETIKRRLTVENSCLIYEQLIKIGDLVQTSLVHVRTTIIERSKAAFESEHFTRIDLETLISLLSLDELRIAEFDLFVAVSSWVDSEVQRQGLPVNRENRRRVFEPVKGYIVFTALSLEKILNCEEIIQLLTEEESSSLVMHRLDKNRPAKIELKTSRKAEATGCSVLINESGLVEHSYFRTMYLSVNQSIYIVTIRTVYSGRAADLSLKIRDSDGVDLGLKPIRSLHNGLWCFSFKPPLVFEPNRLYTLQLTGDEVLKVDQLSKVKTFQSLDGFTVIHTGTDFEHSDYSGSHFLKSLVFYQ